MKSRKDKKRLGWVDYCRVDENDDVHCAPDEAIPKKARNVRTMKLDKGGNRKVTSKVWKPKATPFFTSTSKVHAAAWGVPAGMSCPGVIVPIGEWLEKNKDNPKVLNNPKKMIASLAEKVPQKCLACYATGGNYRNIETYDAQIRRFSWFHKTPDKEVEDTLVDAIKHAGDEDCSRKTGKCTYVPGAQPKYFRLFDSGDFTFPRDVKIWHNVAKRLPGTKFWMPTTAWAASCSNTPEAKANREAIMRELRKVNKLPNVVVRPSAAKLDQPAASVSGLSAGTSVVEPTTVTRLRKLHGDNEKHVTICDEESKSCAQHFICPGNCGTCRACWSKNTKVVYKRHGLKADAKHMMTLANRMVGSHKPLAFTTKSMKGKWMNVSRKAAAVAKTTAMRFWQGPTETPQWFLPEQEKAARETVRKKAATRKRKAKK